MFFFALGAIASPVIASALMSAIGPTALFYYIGGAHLILIIVSVVRMRIRPTRKDRVPYVYTPRTSFTLGRLMRRDRNNKSP